MELSEAVAVGRRGGEGRVAVGGDVVVQGRGDRGRGEEVGEGAVVGEGEKW